MAEFRHEMPNSIREYFQFRDDLSSIGGVIVYKDRIVIPPSLLSSVAFLHSNCRAELGVKTVKRLLMDNTSPSGTIDTVSFQRAMLQYRNTLDRDAKLSPAMCIFGRPIRDFILIIPGNYRPRETWRSTWKAHEEALQNLHMRCAERLSKHIKQLPPLVVGDHVWIQNQVGPYARKWDKTGVDIEVRPVRDKKSDTPEWKILTEVCPSATPSLKADNR
ncbi:unnamed protein product [Acanthosepion pharaonis]|uniref:Uncharacterized protein n=1 Tax=Acanthosepion pharaonis TaxID=158019 RepID=A0A812AZ51_ACAPH|nr:unnamed protein product [Sepia pharaonis]